MANRHLVYKSQIPRSHGVFCSWVKSTLVHREASGSHTKEEHEADRKGRKAQSKTPRVHAAEVYADIHGHGPLKTLSLPSERLIFISQPSVEVVVDFATSRHWKVSTSFNSFDQNDSFLSLFMSALAFANVSISWPGCTSFRDRVTSPTQGNWVVRVLPLQQWSRLWWSCTPDWMVQ
ncbi:hypothetical protein PC129_g3858 [Phytophthora cactorum]|uniref:Uncharacterized protein n=1 Tax=Phytophthora cactorum TaxID=29920 RepID=A0A8T1A1Y1_9STRA|nr:hypothetical protein PC113_g873 [Phytophthora cactorum]KAG2926752.1 hypothetical protein PC114_g3711 [Phytophthora cactorum]KAG2940014.1 hypothetical protein PC115_g2809 [Phytophthora cactorum]KAG3040847.1 hypothetical protein PC119_g1125 [Phytophthora cactorum]KAG3191275.1 hypothetical protein C6341_g1248 [Phytophthora cactorum]